MLLLCGCRRISRETIFHKRYCNRIRQSLARIWILHSESQFICTLCCCTGITFSNVFCHFGARQSAMNCIVKHIAPVSHSLSSLSPSNVTQKRSFGSLFGLAINEWWWVNEFAVCTEPTENLLSENLLVKLQKPIKRVLNHFKGHTELFDFIRQFSIKITWKIFFVWNDSNSQVASLHLYPLKSIYI